jgi:hypothetical protein
MFSSLGISLQGHLQLDWGVRLANPPLAKIPYRSEHDFRIQSVNSPNTTFEERAYDVQESLHTYGNSIVNLC